MLQLRKNTLAWLAWKLRKSQSWTRRGMCSSLINLYSLWCFVIFHKVGSPLELHVFPLQWWKWEQWWWQEDINPTHSSLLGNLFSVAVIYMIFTYSYLHSWCGWGVVFSVWPLWKSFLTTYSSRGRHIGIVHICCDKPTVFALRYHYSLQILATHCSLEHSDFEPVRFNWMHKFRAFNCYVANNLISSTRQSDFKRSLVLAQSSQ